MRKLRFILPIFLLLSVAAYGQLYRGYGRPLYLWQQPNARAEAMGQGNAALTGSPYTMFNNPASTSFSDGFSASYTSLNPVIIWGYSDNHYSYLGASYNSGKYGAAGFSYHNYFWGTFYITTPESPEPIDSYDANTRLYIFNYSYMLIDGFSAGVNLSYYSNGISPYDDFGAYMLDIGFMKKFAIVPGVHNLYAALSCNNVLNSSTDYMGEKSYLPCILQVAGSYEFNYNPYKTDFVPLLFTACAEYQDVLTSKYYTRLQAGGELSLLEVFKVRGGYYSYYFASFDNPGDSYTYSNPTYGFGLSIPLYRFMKNMPVELSGDYASLPSYFFSEDYKEKIGNYSVYTLNLNVKL